MRIATAQTTTELPRVRRGGDSHQGMVGGRSNPKRLEELAEMLAELRDWAWLEAKVETEKPKQEIWLQVRDWAVGAACQKKLNLDAVPLALKPQTAQNPKRLVPVALKQHTANAGTSPPTERSETPPNETLDCNRDAMAGFSAPICSAVRSFRVQKKSEYNSCNTQRWV